MDEIDGIEVDLALLPGELRACIGLIQRFAVSDDTIRSGRMDTASIEELQALDGLSQAQWHALNNYLDRHMDERPGSNEQNLALVLSAFGEAASEAHLDLRRRAARER